MTARQYIEERCVPIPFSGCWLWLLSVASHGYGNSTAAIAGDPLAHRASFLAYKGPIPAGMLVQHSCDNHWCVNPDHLSLGTDASNAIDKQRKGRAAKKLNSMKVSTIRDLLAKGETQRDIAALFGVHPSSISAIATGDTWIHVEATP